jgi:dUTP pyrophosphatase
VPTGVKMALPKGYVGLVWDKSGLAANKSVHTLAGVIDSSYRGEILIVMKNLGKDDFVITKNMKIAQLLIQPVVHANLIEKKALDDTTRGDNGFGSTGTH